jgi:hypothetical protein
MKNFQMKLLAAGVALASSSVAFGAIDPGTPSGNGELFLTVYDNRDVGLGGQRSYTRDLGTAVNDWVSQTGVLASVGPKSFAADGTWSTFTSGLSAGAVAGLTWDVYAMDITGNGPNGRRFLTTTNADMTVTSNKPTTSNINGGMSSVKNYIDANNNLIPAPGNTDYTQKVSVIAGAGDGTANALNGKGNNLLAAVQFNTTEAVGNGLNFYYITPSSVSAVARSNPLQYTGAKWTLAANGNLSYATAPVPEAETWAMFVAGLLGVGAITRRRLSA